MFKIYLCDCQILLLIIVIPWEYQFGRRNYVKWFKKDKLNWEQSKYCHGIRKNHPNN